MKSPEPLYKLATCNQGTQWKECSEVANSVFPAPFPYQWALFSLFFFFFLLGFFIESFCLAPWVAIQYPCSCLCSPTESFTISQSTTWYLSARRNKTVHGLSAVRKINMPSEEKKQRDSEWQGCRRHREERELSHWCHQHLLILLACANICTPALWTVILPLIASVFYPDALLSTTRSSESCQRGPLSSSHRVWQRKHRPRFPAKHKTPSPPACCPAGQERASERERERDGAMGFLLT